MVAPRFTRNVTRVSLSFASTRVASNRTASSAATAGATGPATANAIAVPAPTSRRRPSRLTRSPFDVPAPIACPGGLRGGDHGRPAVPKGVRGGGRPRHLPPLVHHRGSGSGGASRRAHVGRRAGRPRGPVQAHETGAHGAGTRIGGRRPRSLRAPGGGRPAPQRLGTRSARRARSGRRRQGDG